ncbi:hypothetical protein [Mesorhizobium sp. WSM4310]|uniref:hypothetical protein n=1 Tax=Mesorhizobium sp. WSM4310 TaxID=2589883 RepID=UPI00163DD5AB|nr:hypothetical protein [Mesorhizobium sp. WSM4310]
MSEHENNYPAAKFSAARMFAALGNRSGLSVTGVVKPGKGDAFHFADPASDEDWLTVREQRVHSYEPLGFATFQGRRYPRVRLHLTTPDTATEKLYAKAVSASFGDGGAGSGHFPQDGGSGSGTSDGGTGSGHLPQKGGSGAGSSDGGTGSGHRRQG